MKKVVIPGLVILIGLSYFLIQHFRHTENPWELELSGNVEVTEMHLGFKYAGRIVQLLAEEGQKVPQGARLAILDSAETERLVAQSRAALGEAKVKLEELKTGSRLQEIEQATSDVKSSESELDRAKNEYDRSRSLFQNNSISASQFDSSKSANDAAISRLKNATERLSIVKEGPRKEEIRAAKFRVQQARWALAVVKERLKETVLYAPMEGVIMTKNVETGETVAPGIPVYTLGDLHHPWIKVYVKEDKLGRVKLGQSALISVDTFPGKTYEGKVTTISSAAEFTPKNVQTKEERIKLVFGVKISVKNENEELKPGMPADVRIDFTTNEKKV